MNASDTFTGQPDIPVLPEPAVPPSPDIAGPQTLDINGEVYEVLGWRFGQPIISVKPPQPMPPGFAPTPD